MPVFLTKALRITSLLLYPQAPGIALSGSLPSSSNVRAFSIRAFSNHFKPTGAGSEKICLTLFLRVKVKQIF